MENGLRVVGEELLAGLEASGTDVWEFDPGARVIVPLSTGGPLWQFLPDVEEALPLDLFLGLVVPHKRGVAEAALAAGAQFEIPIGCGAEKPVWIRCKPVGQRGRFLYVSSDISRERELEQLVVEGVERERRQIAEDLHDDICQRLIGLSLLSAQLSKKLADDGSAFAGQSKVVSGYLEETIAKMRCVSNGLAQARTVADLPKALRELAQEVGGLFQLRCAVHAPRGLACPEEVAGNLFRIAHEAVYNAAKHSKGTLITIILEQHENLLTLAVLDDGVGYKHSCKRGMGTEMMNYRACWLGASFSVSARSGGGTEVLCQLSIPRASALADGESLAHAARA